MALGIILLPALASSRLCILAQIKQRWTFCLFFIPLNFKLSFEPINFYPTFFLCWHSKYSECSTRLREFVILAHNPEACDASFVLK